MSQLRFIVEVQFPYDESETRDRQLSWIVKREPDVVDVNMTRQTTRCLIYIKQFGKAVELKRRILKNYPHWLVTVREE